MNPPVDDLDPTRLESADFEQVRRGFDPAAVRGELHRAAQEIRRLQRDRDELAGRLAEFEGVSTGQLEARRVAAALGVEATQVLEAAHQAASERAERAEREADAVRDEAREVAEQVRSDAFAEREQILDEARREAETVMAEGRERGREMVAEAQTVRERMLRDLARKRQTGRAQVEQLRAGRDRLLESLSIAQDSLDTAVADLVNSVPEARSAAERAGLRVTSEPVPTADELEGEIEAARVVGHPLLDDVVDPGPVDDTFTTGEMEALPHLDVLDDGSVDGTGAGELVAEAGEAEVGSVAPFPSDRDGREDDEGDEVVPDDVAPDDVAPDDVSEGLPSDGVPSDGVVDDDAVGLYDVEREQHDDDAESPVVADGIGEPTAAIDDEPAPDPGPDPDPEAVGDAPDDEPDGGTEPVVFEAVVDDVFARLRSSQGEIADESGLDDPAETSDDAGDGSDPDPGDPATVDESAVVDESGPSGAAELESVADVLDAERAAARAEATDVVARALKKVLVEEQGTLLDGIRRSGADAVRLVSDDPAGHVAPYEAAAAPGLKTLAAALGGSKRLRLTAALAQIETIALEPVRQRLADVAERVDDPDELSDTVRALYRESRSRRLPQAAAAAAVAVDGLVAIARADGPVEWHVEAAGPCGPDCADNALAGALRAGAEFPTGDKHPPAHAACTCWLVAAAD